MPSTSTEKSGRLQGRRIVVTGGASGIGREIASLARAEGARVGLFDRDKNALHKVVQDLGGESSDVTFAVGDVLDPSSPHRVIAVLSERLGGLDGIVCAAGVVKGAPALDFTIDDWNMVIGINLTGTFLCAQAAARQMTKAGSGGSIVMFSSGLAVSGQVSGVAYVASKAGVIGVCRSLALEFGPNGIRCNNIAPGVVETPMIEGHLSDTFREAWASRNPLGRIGRPGDIAPAACFLLSDDARWITGQTLHINGGNILT
jgi:NAD(P)-dependent dehydrogenase (short-subunit alcohol dehydrogenase family)